jgi:hypothetical protein
LESFLKNLSVAALAAVFCLSNGFAAEPANMEPVATLPGADPDDDGEEKPSRDGSPREEDAGRLVAFARDMRDEKGCAVAAPAFRVVASMGEGEEAAQHELGECLLELKGKTDIETALFRQEAEFWLTRAAFAGNARAQRKLAMDMASPASPLHNPKGSLMWALIYGENPTADLYGYKPLPATLIPGLKSSLNEADAAEAEAFATSFAPIMLAKYESPKPDEKRGDGKGDRPKGPPPGGRRRPG